ncbi:hypothetical protein BJF92_13635 [Rhizobium rhizosphaerae]|uniref:Uncharacterized protein n=1 Tax=Xaviernesmea rhizosphaerae TaxID=1672749 RepID=A0A1Q9AI20_9HYPH|nr:hypothetical protein [Xaviernesmea rhizosphaerae]OLP54846.1 hypothetical protein BJF92_13635 [Xaviernesmea rhizosphaerae]
MTDDHLETWDDVDLGIEDPEPAGVPPIVYRWKEGPEHRAWVGGGTWRLTPVAMTQDEYERRIEAQWAADVADATAAPLRL